MKNKRPLLFGILALGTCVALILAYYFFVGDFWPRAVSDQKESARKAHVYKAPDKPINSVVLKVLYAVPSDKVARAKDNWREIISGIIADVSRFHAIQFRGLSKILPDLYPEPVFLERESAFYDSEKTDAGNPHALIAVAEEIERRVFTPDGDLYRKDFMPQGVGEYVVMGIVYEGLGASGGLIYDSPLQTSEEIALQLGLPESIVHIVGIESADGFLLVNSGCLVSIPCEEPGPSLFYHEFAHALGVQDQYEGDHSFSEDIMGFGRFKPLDTTYIDRSTLKEMGVL